MNSTLKYILIAVGIILVIRYINRRGTQQRTGYNPRDAAYTPRKIYSGGQVFRNRNAASVLVNDATIAG